jgi:hypothetical protein
VRPGAGRPFPDARQTLLLRAALGAGEDARAAWERFTAAGGRIEELDAASVRLLPQLYRNLEAVGVPGGEAMIKLRGVYRHAWYRNQVLLHAAGSSVRALQGAGIRVMALKGAAVTALYPGGLGTRPMNDVDLLVEPADVDRAVGVLAELGYAPAGVQPLVVARRIRHAMPFRRADGVEIDLHWHLLVHAGDDRAVWARARPGALAGAPILVPAPADQLLHTCVHGLGAVPAPVRWVADAALIIRAAGDLDWDVVVEQAQTRDLTVVTAAALDFLAGEIGVPVPARVIETLAGSPASPSARLAQQLACGRIAAPHLAACAADYWDSYRRRERGARRRPSALGFASYVADTYGLPGRRALGAEIVRKAVGVARLRA